MPYRALPTEAELIFLNSVVELWSLACIPLLCEYVCLVRARMVLRGTTETGCDGATTEQNFKGVL